MEEVEDKSLWIILKWRGWDWYGAFLFVECIQLTSQLRVRSSTGSKQEMDTWIEWQLYSSCNDNISTPILQGSENEQRGAKTEGSGFCVYAKNLRLLMRRMGTVWITAH